MNRVKVFVITAMVIVLTLLMALPALAYPPDGTPCTRCHPIGRPPVIVLVPPRWR